MTDGKEWRTTIVLCVAVICLSAVICCWILKPARYQSFTTGSGGMWVFDTVKGEFQNPKE
jgi:hypothetical protein